MLFLGSAIAVEHIFSSGRDTISIHHASLQPETIHTLIVMIQGLFFIFLPTSLFSRSRDPSPN